jgi:hypothetical protein
MGEIHPASTLTNEVAVKIFTEAQKFRQTTGCGKGTIATFLGVKYKVSKSVAANIMAGRTWRQVVAGQPHPRPLAESPPPT